MELEDRMARRAKKTAMLRKKSEQMEAIRSATDRVIAGLAQVDDQEERKLRVVSDINRKIEEIREAMADSVQELSGLGMTQEGIASLCGVEVADIRAINAARKRPGRVVVREPDPELVPVQAY